MSDLPAFCRLPTPDRRALAAGILWVCLALSPAVGLGADAGDQKTEGGEQKTEDGGQKTEDGGQTAGSERQNSEGEAAERNVGEGPVEGKESGSETGGESDSEPAGEKLEQKYANIVDRWELETADGEPLEKAGRVREALAGFRDRLGDRVDALATSLERERAGVDSLNDQIDNPALPQEAKAPLNAQIALGTARATVLRGRRQGWKALQSEIESALGVLDEHIAALEKEAEKRSKRDDDEQRRVEEAKKAEQSALEQLERAREEQQQERNREIKELIAERSRVLTRIAEVAGEQSREIQELSTRRSSVSETFVTRQDRIDGTIRDLPDEPDGQIARERVDPLFRDVRTYRREARRDYANELDRLETALAQREVAEQRRQRARSELDQLTARAERLGDSELTRRKIEVAEAELEYEQRVRDKWDDVVAAHRKLLDIHGERVDYYARAVERILPKISDQARDEFFSIWKSENWRGVAASLDETRRFLSRKTELRLQQLRQIPERIYEAEFWGWIFGLLWRLLMIPIVIFAVRNYSGPLIQRLMDALLHRNFFRQHAAGTLKFGELLRSLIWPTALFGVGMLVATYAAASLPEVRVVVLGLEVTYIYWAVLTVVKVLFLPRSYRERADWLTPAPNLGRLADRSHLYGGDVVDVAHLDLEPAKRLVRTGRRILVFVLAAWIVPHLFADVVGHNVLWNLVDNAFEWAVIGMVYYELSVWRDDIAGLFRKLAGSRIPRAADFVDRHKDRIYGVLIIALATVYVVAAEIAEFGRRYVVDTEISQQVGNFVFRKKIELKQKERAETPEEETGPKALPDDYLACFADRPLVDEAYLIEKPEVLAPITETWQNWLTDPRQGSVTITGETGIGKTTVLNQLYRRFVDDDRAPEVVYTQVFEKIDTVDGLFAFLADIFELDRVPETREALVESLLEASRRVVLLDDCHFLYLRKIGGFEALTALFDIVNLTDHRHFWVMTFNKYGWRYLDRVHEQQHFFGRTLHMEPWEADELKALVDRRNESLAYNVSYADLVVMPDDRREAYYEVIKTARGYFRLLQDFCEGNPRVAIAYWLNNLSPDGNRTLQVRLFERPSLSAISNLSDDHLFTLTALVQHGALSAREVAAIINAEPGFCQRALDYLDEEDIARKHRGSGRYTLSPLYYRPVVTRLTSLNFLWS